MSYRQRLSMLLGIDTGLIFVTVFISSFIMYDFHFVSSPSFIVVLCGMLMSHYIFSFFHKLYKKAWEYASIGELISIVKIGFLSLFIVGIVQFLLTTVDVRLLVIMFMVYLLTIGSSRFCWRMFRDTVIKDKQQKKRTLIIGAGAAGTMVARQLLYNREAELQPVAFIDDNENKQYLDIFGLPVVGGMNQLQMIVNQMGIEHIIIAIPSLQRRKLNDIFQKCLHTSVKTQVMPMLEDIMTGKVEVNQLRDVQVEDLLGRDPIELNIESISEKITGKVVLVTGAGGSIGSEICRQVARFNPSTLVLLGHGENSIYSIEMELKPLFSSTKIQFVTEICDVQDEQKIKEVMGRYHPHIVYHAAAHKHVPLMERNPEEAVKNNVIGTMNVAKAADISLVDTFVLISTDKAVNPTSVMGATKRLAEMMIQHMSQTSQTTFIAVRFGNVLGSRGSVIPLFKKQIEAGGPVTVTHPDMIRYFMTIPEAAKLVIQASSLANGGEIFVLDMGEPVKIVDLAQNLIRLSGYSVEEIGIHYTGMRPGEKLFEELLNEDEIHDEQIYPKIYVGKTAQIFIEEIETVLQSFSVMDKETLKAQLLELTNRKPVREKIPIPS
ncbi:polysaccharide biosynthesis protein [Alkalihalobacterium bogoriense]|uniref:polysaccharide biosynthesis protein n=1 Tax=Alkalihalobacterium bogoriense TaxID=246272 RepID=UPI00047A4A98|nr:nucleoside-diphosphate sugar epimerase/dehydratase [Alkalihalobacterium bogoriense]